MDKRVDRLKN